MGLTSRLIFAVNFIKVLLTFSPISSGGGFRPVRHTQAPQFCPSPETQTHALVARVTPYIFYTGESRYKYTDACNAEKGLHLSIVVHGA